MGYIKSFKINNEDLDDVAMIKPSNIEGLNYNKFFEKVNIPELKKEQEILKSVTYLQNVTYEMSSHHQYSDNNNLYCIPDDFIEAFPLDEEFKCNFEITLIDANRTVRQEGILYSIKKGIYDDDTTRLTLNLYTNDSAEDYYYYYKSHTYDGKEGIYKYKDDSNIALRIESITIPSGTIIEGKYYNAIKELNDSDKVEYNYEIISGQKVLSLPTTNIPVKLYAAYDSNVEDIQIERDENGLVSGYKDIEGNSLGKEQYMEWLSKVDYCKGQLQINGIPQPVLKKSNAFPIQVDLDSATYRFEYTNSEEYDGGNSRNLLLNELASLNYSGINSTMFTIYATGGGGGGGCGQTNLARTHGAWGGGSGAFAIIFIRVKKNSLTAGDTNYLYFELGREGVNTTNPNTNGGDGGDTIIKYRKKNQDTVIITLGGGKGGLSGNNVDPVLASASSGIYSQSGLVNNTYEDEFIYIKVIYSSNGAEGGIKGSSGSAIDIITPSYSYNMENLEISQLGGRGYNDGNLHLTTPEWGSGGGASIFSVGGNGYVVGRQTSTSGVYGSGGGGGSCGTLLGDDDSNRGRYGGMGAIRIVS